MYQDILRDSEIYQMIMQEGREEERRRELQDQRLTILRIMQAFPKLARLAIDLIEQTTDTKKLQDLTVSMSISQAEDEARQYLTEINRKDQN